MNFITAKEFLSIDKTIQKSFINWWKPKIGDLFCDIDAHGEDWIGVINNNDKLEVIEIDKRYDYYIPLLTETQLRDFIEENSGKKIMRIVYDSVWGYCFYFNPDNCLNVVHNIMEKELIMAYWKLACAIDKKI